MPKRSSKQKSKLDLNQNAARVVRLVTQDDTPIKNGKPPIAKKNPAAVALGRLGGLKGGRARANGLSPARRSEIARVAAEKRWKRNGDR